MAGAAVTFAAGAALASPFAEPDVTVLNSFYAEQAGDGYGWVAEAIGDLDGDGAAEYVIGAPFSNAGGNQSGRAYVYAGATGALLAVHTGAPGDRLGFSITGLGDVDGDLVPDYAVSGLAVTGVNLPGRALVLSGATHEIVHDLAGGVDAFFGFDIQNARDVDCDGVSDLIVGSIFANGGAGEVTMFSGRTGATLWTQAGFSASGQLGSAVTGTDDLDGDGVPDQVVGARTDGPDGTGLAYVLSGADGAMLDVLAPPSAAAGRFGAFFAHDVGDLDGDRVADVYISDFADGTLAPNSGRGYVFSGATGEAVLTIEAISAGEGLGMARGAGDLDRDRRADLIVGAYLHGDVAEQGGQARLISGCDGRVIRTMTGTEAGHQLGFDVVALGDVNGDRRPDWLITGVDVAHVVAGNRIERRWCGCHDDDDDNDDDDQ
ncbi:hypothetical protein [Haliangium sp.]|uniref:hypothetical protein n=1 Tax=Haliangium sp. TaxID=2663208 RepID=UPI003D12E734